MPPKTFHPERSRARPMASQRSGITLIEVTFAIGVILIGMVGLTAILPLAGGRAQDALNFDTAAAMSDAVLKEVASRELLQEPRGWTNPPSPQTPKIIASGPIERLNSTVATPTFIKNTSAGFIRPFCFDPLFAADPPATVSNAYSPYYFPYYKLNHNPLLDPATSGSQTPPGISTQPRMLRVGLNFHPYGGYYGNFAANATAQLEVARTLAESPNDLDVLRPKDRSVPGFLSGVFAAGTTFAQGKRLPTGTYSWMITVDPDAKSQYASLSVVIFQSRERMIDFPAVSSGTPPTEPQDNAVSERLALVTEATGFTGGAGGSVTLVSSSATVSELTSNDWVMLSRHMDPRSTTGQYDVHAWYRVVGTDGDATEITSPADAPLFGNTVPLSALAGGGTVWARNVLLDGPDWDFVSNSNLTPLPNPNNWYTYATIVQGVVAVNEKTISLADF